MGRREIAAHALIAAADGLSGLHNRFITGHHRRVQQASICLSLDALVLLTAPRCRDTTDLNGELKRMALSTTHVNRRRFLLGLGGSTVALLVACGSQPPAPAGGSTPAAAPPAASPTAVPQIVVPTLAPAASPATASSPSASPAASPGASPAASPAAAAPAQSAPAAATSASAPAAAAKPSGPVKRGGTLRINSQNDWSTMDVQTSQTGNQDSPLVYDFLARIDHNLQTGAFEVKPHLAESWDTSSPTSVLIKLRPNVKFHDGSDLTAEVVKWNLDRCMTHPKSGAKAQLSAIESVEVADPLTVRLKLKYPSPTLFVNLTSDARYVSIMSKAFYDKVGDEGVAKQAVGTGPFKLAEWKAGQSVRYERFDGYWMPGADGKPLPYPDGVELRFQADAAAALLALRSGDLDVLPTVLGKDIPTIKSNADLVYQEAPWQATIYCLGFNARPGKKFAGEQMKKVRQAAQYAIDREGIARALGLGLGAPNYYLLAPGQIGFDESLPKYTFDLDKAKQLMSEAGYANGIETTLDYISRPEDQQNAQLYQQMLEKIGIKLNLQPSERVAWVQKTLAGDYEFSAFQTGTPRPDSDLTLTAYLGTNGTSAWVGLNNAEIDKLLDQGRTESDAAKRIATYAQVQKLIFDDASIGFTWRRNGAWAFSKAVKDFGDPYLNVVTSGTGVWLDR
jgi:ABC-type transport system substrate-binding protein